MDKRIREWKRSISYGDKTIVRKKIKELKKLKEQKKIDQQTFVSRNIFMRATFYHVYYFVRNYFDEMSFKVEICELYGIDIYADIYTYAHILTRHYYPEMNDGIGGSLNEYIAILDIWNLPSSILELVKLYAKEKTITKETEYLLFIIENKKYILWMQYKKTARHNNKEGMQIRSFYRCEKESELEKFNDKTTIKINESLSIVV